MASTSPSVETSPLMRPKPIQASSSSTANERAASRPIAPAAARLPRGSGASGACTKIGCGAGVAYADSPYTGAPAVAPDDVAAPAAAPAAAAPAVGATVVGVSSASGAVAPAGCRCSGRSYQGTSS